MLRGHTFKKQIYPTEANMELVSLLTNKLDGVIEDYGGKMEIRSLMTGSYVVIYSGMAIIQGNIIEEDSTTVIDISDKLKNNGKLSLVIEINLNEENTEEKLKQASYKILEGEEDYPTLTKQNITSDGKIYQYELARIDVSSTGIEKITDMRKIINLSAILASIERK